MSLEKISYPQGSPHTPLQANPVLKSKNLELSSWQIDQVIKGEMLATKQWWAWHAKAVRALGPEKYHELADMAKRAKNPTTLFSWLIKQEMR